MTKQSHRPMPYGPDEALLALYRRRGAVINSGVGRHGYTYLLGPEANKFAALNPKPGLVVEIAGSVPAQ